MPVPVKIQGDGETVEEAIQKLEKACLGKAYKMKILIQTRETAANRLFGLDSNVIIVKSLELQVRDLLKSDEPGIHWPGSLAQPHKAT